MWKKLAHIILKFRLPLIIVLGLITVFMGYHAQDIEMSYDLVNVVPPEDPDMQYFQGFKDTFGEDGNIMAIGVKDSSLYQVKSFQRFRMLTDELERLNGVTNVLGLPNLKKLEKSSAKNRFELTPVFPEIPDDQKTLDSLLGGAASLKFYSGQLINAQNGATLILLTVDLDIINSENRNVLINDITRACDQFQEVTGIDVHYAGLPYLRTRNMEKTKAELKFFLVLSIAITGLILFLFFRSFKAVLFPLIIIGVMVVWVLGTISLFDYKVTALTGLIPSIIVVIGIPNSVYMLNKYHQEYALHGDQMRALSLIIRKIGIVTFITNFTTAVGFLVLLATDVTILKEFGVVAGINIMCTFIVSVILIPAVYSYLAPPSTRHLKHLDFKFLNYFLNALDILVHRHRPLIFVNAIVIVIISAFGLNQLSAVSFMVDDVPENSSVKVDLQFFEQNFSGIMPLEVVVDTGAKKGVQNLRNLRKIDEFESFLQDSIDYISQPVSVVSFIKAARQAFYNQNPRFYSIPNNRDQGFILRYLKEESDSENISQNFVDSTGQKLRVSLKVADIGSTRMDSLVNQVIRPKIDEIFGSTKLDVDVTGTSLLFIKGNKFLIENLITSMIIAFFVIALIMALLFRNFKMIIISLIPNMIPLLITGGIMGYFGIPLKPSTALIFSIAFGISVDDSIHFLAKYRQELFANNFVVPIAVSKSLRETGASMVYTSIILFFGFVIFTASEFGGTQALGKLTSITLLFAMLTNVIVLPALLLQFDTGKRNKKVHPLIEQFPEFAETGENGEASPSEVKEKI